MHPAFRRPGIQPVNAELYVVTVLSNPLRWINRYRNYWDFHHHVHAHGAQLVTVELAQGERPFELVQVDDTSIHVQIRSRDEMFHKENLMNIGARFVPATAKYIAFIDADMIFTRPDWVQETIQQLQHYEVVQMFSSFTDLLPNHRTGATHPSFMYNFFHRPELLGHGCYGPKWLGSPGGAWAYRVESFKRLGGLLDRCIVGAGDAHMAYGLVQRDEAAPLHAEMKHGTDQYRLYVRSWQANAAQLRKNVGYVEAHMIHKWHGPRSRRGYADRWKILESNAYDPYVDVRPDADGVLEFSGNKPRLRDDIRAYFRSRNEDSDSPE